MVVSQRGLWEEAPGLEGFRHSLLLQSEHLACLSPTEYPSTAAFQGGKPCVGFWGRCTAVGRVSSAGAAAAP